MPIPSLRHFFSGLVVLFVHPCMSLGGYIKAVEHTCVLLL